MENEPKLHNATVWVTFRSGLQWLAGSILFLFFVPLIVVVSFIVSPYRLDPLILIFTTLVVKLTGVKLRVHGREKLIPHKPYLFVSNHLNMFDHFFIYVALKRSLRGVEKEDHFRWPLYGILIKRIGMVPIPPRGDTQRAILALARLRRLFEDGISIAIFPEGTRSKNGKLQPFKKGAFYLALESQATLVPIVLTGNFEFNRKGDWRLYPRPIDLYIEEPISASGEGTEAATRLRDQVRSVFIERLEPV